DNVFFTNNLGTVRSSSSSSECLTKALGVSSEGSLESNEDSDHANSPPGRKQAKSFKIKNRYSNSDSQWTHCPGKAGGSSQHLILPEPPAYTGPQDLATFLEQIGCLKYLQVFEEQDVDLRIFLTLTESDLKEIGITLFGPKRKMTSAIARWHSNARPPSDALELAYADRLEAEMQELAIQLHKRCEEVEVMKGQVCQEQKLRAVAESCLMERDESWNAIQRRLREVQAITKDAGALLDQIKSCQAELSSRLTQEQAGSRVLDTKVQLGTGESRRPVLEGWPPSLKSLSLPELSAVLEECVGEMGKALQTVTQNLQRLQAPGQSGQSWLESRLTLLEASASQGGWRWRTARLRLHAAERKSRFSLPERPVWRGKASRGGNRLGGASVLLLKEETWRSAQLESGEEGGQVFDGVFGIGDEGDEKAQKQHLARKSFAG
ncbi:PREDICTED: ankyrin repeat and SAM domain-containing protein 3-like, partial [Chlamydotis macqueenii]|uniref:ankyrin repeat and SAM domain-containing protein 3-like n=1 Tax=Chlamydotis macqueenii TaxID=187382 RepID=UPI00052A0F43